MIICVAHTSEAVVGSVLWGGTRQGAGQRAMELNQVSYFINLAETLNFTAAARLSGVSQPSLTRAIRRLEEELGGPLIYRDGKNSRLTSLGQDVELEIRRMLVAMKSVRHHSENWAMGRHRVLDVAVASRRRPEDLHSLFRQRAGRGAVHRDQTALAPIGRGHVGGALRQISRVHPASRIKAGS